MQLTNTRGTKANPLRGDYFPELVNNGASPRNRDARLTLVSQLRWLIIIMIVSK